MDHTRNALHMALSASNAADETISQEFATQEAEGLSVEKSRSLTTRALVKTTCSSVPSITQANRISPPQSLSALRTFVSNSIQVHSATSCLSKPTTGYQNKPSPNPRQGWLPSEDTGSNHVANSPSYVNARTSTGLWNLKSLKT